MSIFIPGTTLVHHTICRSTQWTFKIQQKWRNYTLIVHPSSLYKLKFSLGVPLHWFSVCVGGVLTSFVEISVIFFAIRHDFVHIFRKFSKIRSFFARLTCALPPPPSIGDQNQKKNQKKIKPWRVTYQMKGNDFSIRPFNVLDQLEVIWPHHDRKCDLRWPPWP